MYEKATRESVVDELTNGTYFLKGIKSTKRSWS